MDDFEKLINASDLIEWIIETYPDWCESPVRGIIDHIDEMPSVQPPECPEYPEWAQEVERLYNKALCKPYIKKPFAWALHEVWKMYDKMEVEHETD